MSISNVSYDSLTEKTPSSTDSNAESGSGGGDMDIWSESNDSLFDALIFGNFTDNSSKSIKNGLGTPNPNGYGGAYDIGPVSDIEKTNETTDPFAESGSGGGDMDIWSESKFDIVTALAVGNYTDESSFGIPKAIVNSATNSYNTPDADIEKNISSTDSNAESGSGGGTMDVWFESRQNKLTKLAVGSFTNKSKFKIPAAITISSTNPYDTAFPDSEKNLGNYVKGSAFDVNKDPLGGFASIEDEDGIVSESLITGYFVINTSPGSGVTSGSSGGSGGYNFRFSPSFAGADFFKEDIGTSYDAGDIEYGSVTGTVTDYQGDVVTGVDVSFKSDNFGVSTDDNGDYEIKAPGGPQKTLLIAEGAIEEVVTISAYSSSTVDLQFAGLKLVGTLPNGDPVENMPLKIGVNGDPQRTDENGETTFNKVNPNSDVKIYVGSNEVLDITSGGQGNLSTYRVRIGSGVSMFITSEDGGDPVVDVDCKMYDQGGNRVGPALTFSNRAGITNVGVKNAGTYTIVLAEDDRRFLQERIDKELKSGEVKDVDVSMDRQQNVGTAN